MTNLAIAPIDADPANDVDPRAVGNQGEPASPNVLGGMNQGGCQPGIGVNTGELDPKVEDFTQATVDPLLYARIGWGGDSVETGQETADLVSSLAADYENSDFNDTLIFSIADAAVAPGGVMDTVLGSVNRSDKTSVIGEWSWGTKVVA